MNSFLEVSIPMDYKNTIITPKTDFPMKAGLPTREPGMLSRWEEQDLYEAMLEKNKDLPPFVLHDGPPFSNGDIHMGHALNKTLKDFIVRSHAMMGYYTPYVPGWDNHGLPLRPPSSKEQAQPQGHARSPVPRRLRGIRRDLYPAPDGGLQASGRCGQLEAPLPHHGQAL